MKVIDELTSRYFQRRGNVFTSGLFCAKESEDARSIAYVVQLCQTVPSIMLDCVSCFPQYLHSTHHSPLHSAICS